MLTATTSTGSVVPTGLCCPAQRAVGPTGSSGHPSPTDSGASKTSRSDLPDTHSESSRESPTSPHSGRSSTGTKENEMPQDLSVKKRPTTVVTEEASSYEVDPLGSKCSDCGCLFANETLLKLHVQETHLQPTSFAQYRPFADGSPLRTAISDPNSSMLCSALQDINGQHVEAESDAIASLLALQHQQRSGGFVSERSKIFNPEAFCEICNKEFCNKYYLQTHKATKHGQGYPAGFPSLIDANGSSPLGNPQELTTSASGYSSGTPFSHAQLASSSLSLGGGLSDQSICPYCGQGFGSSYHLQTHILSIHVASSSAGSMYSYPTAALQAMYAAQLMNSLNTNGAVPMTALSPSMAAAPANPLASLLERQMKMIAATGVMPSGNSFGAVGGSLSNQTSGTLSALGLPIIPADLISPGSLAGLPRSGLDDIPRLPSGGGSLDMTISQTAAVPTMNNTGLPNSSSMASSAQVMNKDAYCEMCQKYFCNKYFLRTHKQKKHGIFTEDSPVSASLERKRSYQNGEYPPTSAMAYLFQNDSEASMKQSQNEEQLGPPSLKRSLIARALQDPQIHSNGDMMQTILNGPQNTSPSADGSNKLVNQQAVANGLDYTQNAFQKHGELQNDNFQTTEQKQEESSTISASLNCNMCSRSFQSMFTLVAHKYREHAGVGLDSGSLTRVPIPTYPGASTPKKEITDQSAIAASVDPDAYCELCQKEFCSKYFLKTHRLNIHGIVSDSTPPSGLNLAAVLKSPPTRSPGGLNITSAASPMNMSDLNTQGFSVERSMSQGAASSRPRYTTGKNFCDICNKEVCNKYFLRTHMLKMHGIVIDENKTVIGNINTLDREKLGSLVFRCDVCSKEMSSRQSLIAHKQNVHGIQSSQSENEPLSHSMGSFISSGAIDTHSPGTTTAPPNVTVTHDGFPKPNESGHMQSNFKFSAEELKPQVDQLTERCPICSRMFKSMAWLQVHIDKDHSSDQFSYIKNEQTEGNSSANQMHCDYCPATFKDIIELQLHVIGQHAMEVHGKATSLAEQAALNNFGKNRESLPGKDSDLQKTPVKAASAPNLEAVKSSPPIVVRQQNGTKLYRCSYCHYYTKWLSNLSVHERRHTGGTPREEKPFVCNICLRAYRYAHSLERHKSVHRYSFYNGTSTTLTALKMGSPQKAMPTLSKDLIDSPDKRCDEGVPHNTATAAKRYRCTKCQKLFKSRDLCRSHLFAVHRRQEIMQMMSPYKEQKETSYEGDDQSAATIAQVVEELHNQKERQLAAKKDGAGPEVRELFSSPVPSGFATPANGSDVKQPNGPELQDPAGPGRPYALQSFLVEAGRASPNGVNGGSEYLFERMTVYLPVLKRLSDAVQVSFKLTPLEKEMDGIINV